MFQIRLKQQAATDVAALRARLQIWAEERGWTLAGSEESADIVYHAFHIDYPAFDNCTRSNLGHTSFQLS